MYDRLSSCPICGNQDLENFLICTDHFISGESFAIVKCSNCDNLITNPRPGNLEKYYESDTYISHSSNIRNPVELVYNVARFFTIRWKYKLIKKDLQNGQLLDVGCGVGDFLNFVKNKGHKFSGIEPGSNARKISESKLDQSVLTSIDEISGTYSAVTLWHVLEHLTDPVQSLLKLKKHLDTSGSIYIAVPNYKSLDATKYREHWAGFDVPRHLFHFSPDGMMFLIRKAGMKLVQKIPMKLDAYYVSMLSEQYLGSSTITKWFNSFVTGYISNSYGDKDSNYSSIIYRIRK